MDLVLDSLKVIVAHQAEQSILIRYFERSLGRLNEVPIEGEIVLVGGGSCGLAHPRVFLDARGILRHHLGTVLKLVAVNVPLLVSVAGVQVLC